jgi:hypothetical protein
LFRLLTLIGEATVGMDVSGFTEESESDGSGLTVLAVDLALSVLELVSELKRELVSFMISQDVLQHCWGPCSISFPQSSLL